MNNFITKTVSPFLAKRGFVLQKAVDKEKIIQLIDKLHPVQTQYELIRLGPKGDGGYLVPDCLDTISACFSPGVAEVSEFESDCLNLGMQLFMADASVEKPNWTISEEKYRFQKKFIGCTNNEEFMTMDTWFKSANLRDDMDLLLQMDIERSEYAAIINTSDELMKRFKVMVIEFHFLQQLWNKGFFKIVETTINKILHTHICVHLHPNNFKGTNGSVFTQLGIDIPKVLEMTFLRKDVADIKGYQTQFPHPLDCDNTTKEHFPLPKNWYHNRVK